MCLNDAHRNIILIFSVSLIVTFQIAFSIENSQQYVPCKPGWYFFGEKCYKVRALEPDTGLNWFRSDESCKVEGGHLASIHSKESQEFLTTVLLLNSKSNAWIGLHDQVSESEFTWVDASIYDYKNWDKNEPSRRFNSNEEDCVEMRYSNFKDGVGKWNNEHCGSLRPHICQVDKNDDTKSPDPRFCSIEDGGGWKYLNSCYHIVKEEKSWEDAKKYCEEKYKGYLVSILDDNTEVFLNYIMKLSYVSKDIWIGIKMGNYSMQKWTSGWHVANKKFNQGELHFANGTCAVKSNSNTWGIAPCPNKYPFICEKIKYNVPVLQKPPSDDWRCPYTGKNWVDLGGDYCYYIEYESSKNWLEANYECGRKGGTLASFHSENETNILHPHVLETQDRLLIGLRRSSKDRHVFEWADGTEVIYQNWHKGEPNSRDEICGELWTESMKWNDLPCSISKGYICKTQKMFSRSKFKEFPDQVSCNSDLSKDQTHSSGIPVATVIGIVFCTLLVSLIVGAIVYHYRDYWNIYCTKTEKDGYTTPGSLGPVSDKVIWKQQGEEPHY